MREGGIDAFPDVLNLLYTGGNYRQAGAEGLMLRQVSRFISSATARRTGIAAQRYQGQRDIPLNDRGRAQAQRNGEVLKAHLADLRHYDFLCSPLGRTRETMEIMRRAMGLPPHDYILDERVRELHYGHWEGQLAADLSRADPKGVAERSLDPFHWRPTGGESYSDLTVRTNEWLASIVRDAIVVTHGGVSRTLRGSVLDLEKASITRLDVPQDRVLELRKGFMRWI